MSKSNELIKCCLCKEDIEVSITGWKFGHNPQPLANGEDDRCCDFCNTTKVIPKRLELILKSETKST